MLKKFTLLCCMLASATGSRAMTETKTTHAVEQEATKPLTMQEIATKTLQSPYKAELLELFNAVSTCTSKSKLLPKLMIAIKQHYQDLDTEKARDLRYKNREKYAQAKTAFTKDHAEKNAHDNIERIQTSLNPYVLPLSHAGEPVKFFMDELIDLITNGSKLYYHECHNHGVGPGGFDFQKMIFNGDSPEKACARTLHEIFYHLKSYQGSYRLSENSGDIHWMRLENDAFAYRAKEQTDISWREPYVYCYQQVYAQYKKYYNATGELPEEHYAPEVVLARIDYKAQTSSDEAKKS